MSRYIVIVGCGRLGSLLAGRLSQQGDSVVVIDREEHPFEALPAAFSGFCIQGNAVDLEVLQRAKTDQADGFVAATDQDNVNLTVAQIARVVFGVETVVARVSDPANEQLYRTLGVATVSPTQWLEEAFLKALAPSNREEQP